MILNYISGATIQSTLDEEQTKTHAAALSELTAKASFIVGMLNQDGELTFLRICSKQREIMVRINCSLPECLPLSNPSGDWIFLDRNHLLYSYAVCHSKISPDKEFLLVVLQNPNPSERIKPILFRSCLSSSMPTFLGTPESLCGGCIMNVSCHTDIYGHEIGMVPKPTICNRNPLM